MGKTVYSKEHRFLVKRLITAREKSGLTQAKVAKLLGKSQATISKMEAGQRRIDLVELKEFAKLYRKDIEFFLKD